MLYIVYRNKKIIGEKNIGEKYIGEKYIGEKMSAQYTKYDIRYTSAYTLIEILVTLTIIGILFSVGFANFRDFSRRQAISGESKSIQSDLRLAQQQATSGQKPSDCISNLDGYEFQVFAPSEYKIYAICGAISSEIKDVNITSGISISTPQPNPIIFKVLGQGTNIAGGGSATITLTQAGTSNTINITISSGGEIK